MSPTTDNFIHSLVEMSKAFEELPTVQEELAKTKLAADHLANDVQAREEHILKLKSEIEALQSKVRTVEAERDDAELRFLELDEKAHKALGDFEAIAALVNAGKNELSPPKPEPQPEPLKPADLIERGASDAGYISNSMLSQGQSEPDPMNTVHAVGTTSVATHASASTTADTTFHGDPSNIDSVSSNPAEVPKSDANPTQTGEAVTGEVVTETTAAKPYAGKRYYNHQTYLTLAEWLSGGGTEDDYNWRPSYQNQF